jgi:Mg-chelatase subunit ChlD
MTSTILFSMQASQGQNLHTDSARAAHEFLLRSGHTSVDTRILLSQLGDALVSIKPNDPSFKWSQLFVAHPDLFQMVDRHLPGKATIYAIPARPQRPSNQLVRAASSAQPHSTLVPAASRSPSALAVGLTQRGFAAGGAPAVQQQVDVKQVARATNVVVALDLSGSMSDEAFGWLTPAKAAIMQLWDVLLPGDSLSIIAFNPAVTTVMPRRFKWEAKEGQVKRPTQFVRCDLEAVVNGLQACGGTALYHALLQAMQQTRAAAEEDLKKSKSGTFQLVVITDGMDADSATISPLSTAQAVNNTLKKPGAWAGTLQFSSCFVAMGADAQRALVPCTSGLNPLHHHTVDNITDGFRRVTDTIATVRVQQTQTFSKSSLTTGGRAAGA